MFLLKKAFVLLAVLGCTAGAMAANKALQFNGTSDFVQLTSSPLSDMTSGFTIEAWAESDSTSATGTFRIISNHGVLPTRGVGFGAKGEAWRFTTYGIKDYDCAKSSVTTGTWTHIAVVYDKAFNATFYRNGQLLTTVANAKESLLSTGTMTIGRNPIEDTATEFWDGKIDEIRIWNYERTAAQIQAEMNLKLTGSEPGLIGYWPFEEGQGTTTVDASANSADGTLNGCKWIDGPPSVKAAGEAAAQKDWSIYR